MGKTDIDEQDGKDRDDGGVAMVEQKEKSYTITTPMGHKVPVKKLSEEDIERRLSALETKHGMSSREFAAKWNAGELDCAVRDYFKWASYCDYMANRVGIKELEIIQENVQELKIE